MKIAAILACAVLVLAGCTQQRPTSAAAPPATTADDNTTWVPVVTSPTTTTTAVQPVVAAKPQLTPVPPTGYVSFDYETPGVANGAGGSAIYLVAPAGWQRSQDGDKTDFRDPTGQLLVQFERVAPGQPEPTEVTGVYVAGLLSQRAQAARSKYAGYGLMFVQPTTLGLYSIAGAEWQFQFTANGATRWVSVLGTMFGGDLVTVYVSGPLANSSILAEITAEERGTINIAG